jgi:hypothetical protein
MSALLVLAVIAVLCLFYFGPKDSPVRKAQRQVASAQRQVSAAQRAIKNARRKVGESCVRVLLCAPASTTGRTSSPARELSR